MKDTLTYQSYLKSPYKSIKHSTYFNAYDHFLNQYRNKDITFIEIGILGGGSLFMWRDYFGPKARIIGIDVNPNAKKWEKHGFEIYIGSQSDEQFWKDFLKQVEEIDVVLDDGGHTYEQQIITTEYLLGALNDGGILLVEDTHTSYMDGFGPKKYSFISYVKNRIDAINQRFGAFSNKNNEKRFWSIEIVESMVAFKIKKKSTNLISEPTNNNGKDDLELDLRYSDTFSPTLYGLLINIYSFFKSIPMFRPLAIFIRNRIVNWQFSASKYFK